jgi:hypothetical protein
MSKDGLTDRERAAGCTISEVRTYNVEKPDAYLAQDSENQFKTIFFPSGNYPELGVVIKFIGCVGMVEKVGHQWCFSAWPDDSEDNFLFKYGTQDEAQRDRTKLLMQIEEYHSRGL